MAPAQRDAVILLSGLHKEDIGESVDLAAARFVGALEATYWPKYFHGRVPAAVRWPRSERPRAYVVSIR